MTPTEPAPEAPRATNGLETADGPSAELALIVVVALMLLLAIWTESPFGSVNPDSRLATIDSLVHRGTYAIDESHFGTIDKFFVDGRFYSDKPPLLSTLMAGHYWLIQALTPLSLAEPGGSERTVVRLLTVTWSLAPFVVLLLVFRQFLSWFEFSPQTRWIALVAAAGGTNATGFALTINDHVPAATLLFAAVVLAIGLVHGRIQPKRRAFVLAGLLAGAAPTVEYLTAFFSLGLFLYLVARYPRETLTWFALGAVPPLAAHFALNYATTDSLLPAFLKRHLGIQDNRYDYTGSPWKATGGFKGMRYLFDMTVGRKGQFILFPMLLGAFAGLGRALCCRGELPLRREIFGLGAVSLFVIGLCTVVTIDHGGVNYGIRHFICFSPLLLLCAVPAIEQLRATRFRFVILLALAVSLFSGVQSMQNPWWQREWTHAIYD